MAVDPLVQGGGSVYLLRPVSPAGSAWVEARIPEDATWFAGAVAVEQPVHPRHRHRRPARRAPRPMTGGGGLREATGHAPFRNISSGPGDGPPVR